MMIHVYRGLQNHYRLSYALFLLLKVQDYLKRFESIPDMLELDHLTVSGDVTFGKNVSLKVGHATCYMQIKMSCLCILITCKNCCNLMNAKPKSRVYLPVSRLNSHVFQGEDKLLI